MWKSYAVDAVPTAHRVTWADLEGDGKKEIVMAPFVGLKGWEDPKYKDNVPLLYLARSGQAGSNMEARDRG